MAISQISSRLHLPSQIFRRSEQLRAIFMKANLADAMDRPAITGDIVQTWLKRGEDRQTLAFCVNRKHAQHVADCFSEAGVTVEYMDGTTPREDREATFARFRAGDTRIICNVGVLTTGIDLDVRCIVDASPTKSRIAFVQTIGRGLRTAEGKDHLLILDHAGNHLRLGTVRDIGQSHLDDGKPRKATAKKQDAREPLPRLCEECRCVVPVAAKVCTGCGVVIRAKTEVQTVEGELVEFGARRSGKSMLSVEDKAAFFGELAWIAREKGYASGWAAHKYREKFGVWPNDRIRTASPRPPSVKTSGWLTSRQHSIRKGARARLWLGAPIGSLALSSFIPGRCWSCPLGTFSA